MNTFFPETCQAAYLDKKGDIVYCSHKWTHIEEPELIVHCGIHHLQWINERNKLEKAK